MPIKLLSIYSLMAILLFGFSLARAASPSSILVNIVPENPAPNENTTITLSSYANNLDSVNIAWFVNGIGASAGIGKKSFSLTAPAVGAEANVMARIFLPEGEIDTRVVIRPSVMVLLWQANDSYVPPFYKGKAMPTADSEIKIVAIPEIRTTNGYADPKNMTYVWKKDYNNMPEESGYGKNFFVYTNDYLENSSNISVTASTVDQKYSSQANINIGATTPKISFYKRDKVLGTLWEQELLDGHRIQGEEVVIAVPYFISPKEIRDPSLVFSWFINGNPVSVSNYVKNVMPLKVQEGVSGISILGLQIENSNRIFQTVNKEINVEF